MSTSTPSTDQQAPDPAGDVRKGNANLRTTTAVLEPRRLSLAKFQDFVLLAPLALIFIGGWIYDSTSGQPVFLTAANQINVLQSFSEISMLVLAQTLILIAGKMDLSMESTFGFGPAFAMWLVVPAASGGIGFLPMAASWVGPAAVLVAIVAGLVIGAINAFLIIVLKLNGFIVTLGMMIAVRGFQTGLTGGQSLSNLPDGFTWLGTFQIGMMPISILLMLALFAIAIFALVKTNLGRSLYAIGGNVNAAKAAGIRTNKVLWGIFILGGGLAALGGVMQAGRLGGIATTMGTGYIFLTFAACVIAGVSLNGGKGSMLSAFLGVFLLFEVRNLLGILGVPGTWLDALNGMIILAALAVSRFASGKGQD